MSPSNKLLSDITAFRTYARYLKHLGRRETLGETINRNMNMHLDRFPKLSKDIVKAYQRVHDLKVMPSMRSLQFSGDAILKNNVRLFNCSAVAIDNPRVFAEILYVLLSGTGAGFSVQRHHVNQLPKIRHPKEETRFLINDSIMGWAQAVEVLFNAYFFGGVRPVFDYSLIRPKGSYMVTTGAKAPGPAPLKFMLELAESKLQLAIGRKLTTLECHDMVCIISDAVLAGGVRRSSLISLFDKDDKAMLTCKHGEWWNHAPWRARANNSAVLLRSENDKESFDNIFQMCRDSNAGEPGVFFTNSKELLTNPCQPSFAKVTLASGKEITMGELKIGDVLLNRENKETVVLNKWSTGVKSVYVYGVTGGAFVGTANHRLVCKKAGTDVIEKLPAQFLYENASTYVVLTGYGYQSLETEVFIGTHEVFDITVSDETHTYLTNGVYVSNCSEISLNSSQFCNLTTINQTGITNKRDFMNRVYAASLMGTLQASYTDFDYLSPRWKEITDKEALLGVSFTGIADSSGIVTPEMLEEGARFAVEVNEKYASRIGINPAYRITCLKPEGSVSCVLSSSSGIHARHAEHYIRRIRMNADDALALYLKSIIPDLVETDLFSNTGVVVSLPQESPKNAIIRGNESALDLFNRTMLYHDHWINPGHNSGLNRHNVSVTISLKEDEWDVLREEMWNNRHRYTGISLLPFDNSSYKQMPFEEISKEKYDEMSGQVKIVDLCEVREEEDRTSHAELVACVGGVCSIE